MRNPDTQFGTHRHSIIPGIIDPFAIGLIGDVTRVNVYSGHVSGNNTLSYDHIVGTDSLRLLLVAIGHLHDLTSVTFGGVTMTQYGTTITCPTDAHCSLWYLINPASGTGTIVITSTSGNDYMEAGSVDYKNVNQIAPLASYVGTYGIDGVPTINVAGVVGDLTLGWIKYWDNDAWATPDGSMTETWDVTSDNAWKTEGAEKAGAASVTLSWTEGTHDYSTYAGVVIKKA